MMLMKKESVQVAREAHFKKKAGVGVQGGYQ